MFSPPGIRSASPYDSTTHPPCQAKRLSVESADLPENGAAEQDLVLLVIEDAHLPGREHAARLLHQPTRQPIAWPVPAITKLLPFMLLDYNPRLISEYLKPFENPRSRKLRHP